MNEKPYAAQARAIRIAQEKKWMTETPKKCPVCDSTKLWKNGHREGISGKLQPLFLQGMWIALFHVVNNPANSFFLLWRPHE